MWKEIKKIISSNNSNHIFSTSITVNNKTITNPTDIANAFNNYFAKNAIYISNPPSDFLRKHIMITSR